MTVISGLHCSPAERRNNGSAPRKAKHSPARAKYLFINLKKNRDSQSSQFREIMVIMRNSVQCPLGSNPLLGRPMLTNHRQLKDMPKDGALKVNCTSKKMIQTLWARHLTDAHITWPFMSTVFKVWEFSKMTRVHTKDDRSEDIATTTRSSLAIITQRQW